MRKDEMLDCNPKADSYVMPAISTMTLVSEDHRPEEPRIDGPFPARVRGVDARGQRFKVAAELEHLSARDCQIRLDVRPEPGLCLSVATRINRAVVILRGAVLSVRRHADGGAYSVAIEIERYRFVHHHS